MKYPDDFINKVICGDALLTLKELPPESIDCCITSPPYWGLRDYGMSGQFGLEKTPEEYVAKMVGMFREVKRVLKKEGTCWLNLGDSYMSGGGASRHHGYTDPKWKEARKIEHFEPQAYPHKTIKPKDLVGIPWRVAFALQSDGWYLRQDIIWAKPNPMPESVTDRCTKSHEYIFLLAKSQKYYFDNEAIREKASTEVAERKRLNGQSAEEGKKSGHQRNCGVKMATPFLKGQQAQVRENHDIHYDKRETYGQRNKRSVWTITTKPFKEAHFATFPEDLIVPMVKAGCPQKGIVLDPFIGAGTTGIVARKLGRNYLGIELNPKYVKMAEQRLRQEILL